MREAFIIRYGLLSFMHLGCYLDYASHALYTNVCGCVQIATDFLIMIIILVSCMNISRIIRRISTRVDSLFSSSNDLQEP